ncbi:TetR family transcriptional regulator [Caballeronia calidae]|uniref:TetR family transcriptional regulator n=1 Tax=Caballeronia calidae TaxID=1777139 RepID=A0A158E0Z8_9BURK|nr:TetR/AcrR family transcriptional regulator [Caballeronia calidae]SAL00350.1 TetR family transcriptional regulator [Caballeronia calidae]
MGHSQAEKLETHQRIVDIAAKRFRERGIDGVSIADVMREAGLTVGGFYKHFSSRDELVVEALRHALKDIESWESAIPVAASQAMHSYLSESHRDNLVTGCPISALVNDVGRSTGGAREVVSMEVSKIVGLISQASPAHETASKRSDAILVLSACVGAVALSRAVSDRALSREILGGALTGILGKLSSNRPADE